MGSLRRYFEIYAILFRNSLIREMSFKANFLLWIIVELCWFVGQIVFIEVLFQYVHAIGDWTQWQVVLLVGTHQLIAQLFQAFFYLNLVNIPELVRTGKMDFLLLQPVDAQFAASTRQFGLDSVINALVGATIVGWSLWKLGIHPGPVQFLLYAATVVLGIAVHYAVLFLLATLSFWIVRAQGLVYGYYNLFNIGRYPDAIFRNAPLFRFLFSWILPIILVANVPARSLMGMFQGPPIGTLLHLLAAAAIAVGLSRLLWKLALTRYSSASS
jgi:ABC-2 type transport system permease protein